MGLNLSKEHNFSDSKRSCSRFQTELECEEPPRKRRRLEEAEQKKQEDGPFKLDAAVLKNNGNTNNLTAFDTRDGSHQSNLFSQCLPKGSSAPQVPLIPEWNRLPYVAMVEVYRNLPNNDRFSLSQSCKAWCYPFTRPSIWRRGSFKFNGKDDWKGVCFASMMGGALRHVSADCRESGFCSTTACYTAQSVSLFLTSLVSWNNCYLVTLELTHLHRLVRKQQTAQEILPLLTSLLEMQTRLQILDLSHAGLPVHDGLQVLFAAGVSAAPTLKSLAISDTLTPDRAQDLGSDIRMLLLLSKFTHLTDLSLSHKYLSDDVLLLLSNCLHGKLLTLTVWACYFGRADSRTSPESWILLSRKCPQLRTAFALKNISHEQSFRDILTQYIPLKSLSWVSSNHNSLFYAAGCLEHIASHFEGTLEQLNIELNHGFLEDEEHIASVVERCRHLQRLSIASPIMSVPAELRLIRAVRRAVARHDRSQLREVFMNGSPINLKETWATSVIGWLIEHVH